MAYHGRRRRFRVCTHKSRHWGKLESMTTEALSGLAAAGGAALVAAMATDAWQTTRTRFAALLNRDGRRRVEDQMDQQADAVTGTAENARDEARAALVPAWRLQLATFLQEHPEAAQELQEAIAEVRARLPQRHRHLHLEVSAGRDAYTATHDMTVTHHYERGDRPAP
jgi:hypothetical protein